MPATGLETAYHTPYLTRRIWPLLRAAVGGQRNPLSDHKDKIVDFCHLALLQIWGKNIAAIWERSRFVERLLITAAYGDAWFNLSGT